MAKPAHRVQLQKQETAAGGGDPSDDDSFFWDVLDAGEDAPDVAGVYFQESTGRDKVVAAYRESDKLFFEDSENAGASRRSLSDLAAGVVPVAATEMSGSGDITTTAAPASPAAVPGLSITPGAGTYTVWVSAEVENNAPVFDELLVILYAAGAEVSRRTTAGLFKDGRATVAFHAKITIADGEAVEVYWATDKPPATMGNRSLLLLRVHT